MKCPNCGKEFRFWEAVADIHLEETSGLTDEATRRSEAARKLREIPCPNCPAVLKTTSRFQKLVKIETTLFFITFFFGMLLVMFEAGPKYPGSDSLIVTFLTLVSLGISLSVVTLIPLLHVNRWEVARMRHTCKYCGTIMVLEDADFCPNCGASVETPAIERITITERQADMAKTTPLTRKGKPIGTCLVCGLELTSTNALARCPHCGNAFHKTHLLEWVHKKKSCPACQAHLDEKELKEQLVQSEKRQIGKKDRRGTIIPRHS